MAIPHYIGIDWGSSNFRAWLISDDGSILSMVSTGHGALNLNHLEFEDILFETCSEWLQENPAIPVLMAGMVGSKDGWVETSYQETPTNLAALKGALVPVKNRGNRTIFIVPGLACKNMYGRADVLRGEEVLVFGGLHLSGKSDALVCLPGTHSKWCHVNAGRLVEFTTFMTGELYDQISNMNSLKRFLTDRSFDRASFENGLGESQSGSALSSQMFSIRASNLTATNSSSSGSSYLSGLLIGHELGALTEQTPPLQSVTLISDGSLAQYYQCALTFLDRTFDLIAPSEAFVTGLNQLV